MPSATLEDRLFHSIIPIYLKPRFKKFVLGFGSARSLLYYFEEYDFKFFSFTQLSLSCLLRILYAKTLRELAKSEFTKTAK